MKKVLLGLVVVVLCVVMAMFWLVLPDAQARKVTIIFDQKAGYVLYGTNWEGELPESEHVGGTDLWLMNASGEHQQLSKDFEVRDALLRVSEKQVLYLTKNMNLWSMNFEGASKKKVLQKIISPSLSPDENFLVYQKLDDNWQQGQYFEKAQGLGLCDLQTKRVKTITREPQDFNPIFTPRAGKVLFHSINEFGLASLFVTDVNGGNREQLTNLKQKMVSDQTISIASEKPVWRSDYELLFESAGEIWKLKFNRAYTKVLDAEQTGNVSFRRSSSD